MRLFTAIELSHEVRIHLAGCVETLRKHPSLKELSWTNPENLHITLKFLDEIPDSRVPDLANALKRLDVPEMTLTPSHFLVLPGQGPARVLAVNVAGDTEPLAKLFQRIESAVQPLGVHRESRPFKPHITLARVRRPSRNLTAQTLARLVDPSLLPAPGFGTRTFTLYQSQLNPKGATYTPIARSEEKQS
jgi:2'-5' RNA ligase